MEARASQRASRLAVAPLYTFDPGLMMAPSSNLCGCLGVSAKISYNLFGSVLLDRLFGGP